MNRASLALAGATLLGHLPAALLAVCGWLLGLLSLPLTPRRRRIVQRNLAACFPEWSVGKRWAVMLGHYANLGRLALDLTLPLAASAKRFRRLVQVEGLERLAPLEGKPVILLAPHFLGMNHGGVRMNLERELASAYNPQRNPVVDELIRQARTRVGANIRLMSNRQDVMKETVRLLRGGGTLYYLGDMDQRDKAKTVFAPFLGVEQASTLTALPRLARLTGAAVVPCVTLARPLGGYRVEIGEPWRDFPSGDLEADLRRFNDFVGAAARANPTQYYWPHRRFKTRPAGDNGIYD